MGKPTDHGDSQKKGEYLAVDDLTGILRYLNIIDSLFYSSFYCNFPAIIAIAIERMSAKIAGPKVSIIITYFNQTEYIHKTVHSAIEQDYSNLEIVIADDHSELHPFPPELKEDPRIHYYWNEVNLGKSNNYRKSLYEYASGDYALLLNGDDYLIDPTYITKAMEVLRSQSDISLVFGKIQTLLESSHIFVEDACNDDLPEILDGNQFFLMYPRGYRISHLTCLFDRNHAMKMGCYQYSMPGEDWESFLRLMQNKKVGYINSPVGVRRKHDSNFTKLLDIHEIDSGLKMIESPYALAQKNKIASPAKLRKWHYQMLRRYFYKNYVKIHFLRPHLKKDLLRLFQIKYPRIFSRLLWDPRFWIFKLFLDQHFLMNWVFKFIIKQEAFYVDMVNSRKLTIKT